MEVLMIKDVHELSASYPERSSLIGRKVEVIRQVRDYSTEPWNKDLKGYIGADLMLLDSEETRYISPVLLGVAGEDRGRRIEEKRITPYGNLYRRKLRLERRKT